MLCLNLLHICLVYVVAPLFWDTSECGNSIRLSSGQKLNEEPGSRPSRSS